MKYAVIGGTGLDMLGQIKEERELTTPYGTCQVFIVDYEGLDIVFLPRHGRGHSLPPHLINYRANMYALKELGVEYVYTTAAVGSLNENYRPGELVLIKDCIDFSHSREASFYSGDESGVRHVDMTDPYCKNLRDEFLRFSQGQLEIKGQAVYVTTQGPRFETASEILMFKVFGGDVVGMTSNPEVDLARELGICYSTVGIITNWCTGLTDNVEIHNISEIVSGLREDILAIFFKIFKSGLDKSSCNCSGNIVEL